ncbi:LysR family transcriptional regulator [Agaribacterium sp. ZY112]|uniref:LysR family transcriptional regulator n=1 Tax=Agaribacterium sp. ZY112 TaxID=3233574 RepID=UPI0035261D82
MINHLRHMAVFARVVDEGSFRLAAKELGLAPSRVSQTVSDLERYLGVTLLHRSTRKLVLTSEGRRFYGHVVNAIRSAEAGLNELNAQSQAPVGELKISLPAFLASSTISTAISEFAQLHPKVSFSLNYTDQVMDILSEGLDLSIRVGWLEDSSLMARKLGESKRLLVASKRYVETKPLATHPLDLQDWDWVRFHMRPSTVEFTSSTSGETVTITESARIGVNSAEAMRHFSSQDMGLSILPEHLVQSRINSGEFVHVLPEWSLKSLGYYAVWPDKSRRENLTLMFVRFLADYGVS